MNEAGKYGLYLEPDEHITRFSTGHHVQRVTMNERFIQVEDPWLGDFIISDRLMYDFHRTPNAFRAMGISQLCKSRESSTIPNLASFSREWGLLAQNFLVDHFAGIQGLNKEHTDAIHIAVEGDDQAHTAFSHELELAIQKWGGNEDHHEQAYPYLAKLGGTVAVLDEHKITYDGNIKVPGFEIPEWAHATSREDLDIDRLQYIAAEALLWFDNSAAEGDVKLKIRDAISLDNFEITPEGKLAFKNIDSALVVSKLLMLLSTEHWNDPINRAHLHLGVHGVQRAILMRRLAWMAEIDRGETRKGTSYFYGIDQDYTDALETGPGRADDFTYLISNVLNHSGMEERRRFVDYRIDEYSRFILDDSAENYPSEYLNPKRVEFGPRSSSVHTEVVELSEEEKAVLAQVKIPQLEDDADHLAYTAGPLKNRFIDPLVRYGDDFKRLSEISPAYASLLNEHQHLQNLGVRVTFAFTPDYAREFRDGMRRNDQEFEKLSEKSNMTIDQQRRLIEKAAQRAKILSQEAGTLVLKGEAAA
jgi:hypothetical protein